MTTPLSRSSRYAVLFTAIGGLLFDGVELGLMPVASLSVSQSLLGDAFTPALGGDWFARFTAALMLGAAVGGIFLGSLGDRIGRTRALGVSVLFYSVFAQGFVATLFFGWLPLYLPELFPTHVRAAGSGIAYNVGRFATALGVLAAGALFAALGGSYPKVGATCGLIYLLGLIVIWWAPDTSEKKLSD